MSLPESFLALDNALDIMGNVTDGIVVNEAIVKANLARELPFMATEDLMLAAARAGADRQEAHEVIRTVSREVAAELAQGALHNDLLERLAKEALFAKVPLSEFEDASRFVGRASEQVDGFIREVVDPIRAKYRSSFPQKAELSV
jgi:adenylosuccinate lyase